MDSYTFTDALTGSTVSFEWPGLQALMVRGPENAQELAACDALFFPGCSFINYAMPLVQSVDTLLQGAGVTSGVSLLCCGKILSYEPDGEAVTARFEADLRNHAAAIGLKKIVAACPNCVKALRRLLAEDERTADIEVVPLPVVLADLGYRIDAGTAQGMLHAELTEGPIDYGIAADGVPQASDLTFSVHDSCPDRETGEFAQGIRALMPNGLVNEMEHNRTKSSCCGSLIRAMGKWEAADKQANKRADEAEAASAQGIAVACVSCAFQMSMAEHKMPVFHYLELLYNWRVNWMFMDAWMKLRFLFDENLGVSEVDESTRRAFVGLDVAPAEDAAQTASADGGAE